VSNLTQRVLAALIGAPIAIACIWYGGWAFGALGVWMAVGAQREVYGLMRQGGLRPNVGLGLVLGAAVAARALLPFDISIFVVVGLVAAMLLELVRRSEQPLADVSATAFGVFYPSALIGYLVALREAEGVLLETDAAFWLTLGTIVCVWGADSGAYAAGRTLGKTPLFPRVSPNKTWEGAVGGFVTAGLLAWALKVWFVPALGWDAVAVFALCCGVFAPLGDLTESLFKRAAGVKDSGRFLPGHGGYLDRLDALIVAGPLVYLYLDWALF
jgi:phosphatidate cytidylyltransferase